jgi:hypothetical protein
MPRIVHFAALFLLALASCLPVTSKVPVGSTVGFKPDPMLLGTWMATSQDAGGSSYLHILGNDDGSMTALLITPPRKENLGEWSEYRLRTARLGAHRFMNAQEIGDNGEAAHGPLAKQQVVLLYKVLSPNRVAIYEIDEKAAAAAIRAGEIAGEIEPGEDGDIRITEKQPELDAFMRTAHAATLFRKELVTLSRVD